MEIKLKKDSWHYRLQSRVIGPIKLDNFCPYFWLTIFCLFASPFFFSFQGLKKLFLKSERIVKELVKTIDKSICIPLESFFLNFISDKKILKIYEHSIDAHKKTYGTDGANAWQRAAYWNGHEAAKKWQLDNEKFQLWKKENPDWEEKIKEIRARESAIRIEQVRIERERYEAEIVAKREMQKARAEREKKIAAMQLRIANTTKKVAPFILSILGLGVLLIVGFVGVKLVKLGMMVNWVMVGKVIGIVLIGLASLALLALVIFVLAGALAALWKKCSLDIPTPRLPRIKRVPDFSRPFRAIAMAIESFFAFVAEYVKATKKNYCPRIKWEK